MLCRASHEVEGSWVVVVYLLKGLRPPPTNLSRGEREDVRKGGEERERGGRVQGVGERKAVREKHKATSTISIQVPHTCTYCKCIHVVVTKIYSLCIIIHVGSSVGRAPNPLSF